MDQPLDSNNPQLRQSDEPTTCMWERYIALPAVIVLLGWWILTLVLGY
jgi:hypothetical protein